MIKIKVKLGSIVEEETDAIVCPSNSYGIMGGGVAKIIRTVGGAMIEADAVRKAPIPLGQALITDGGMLPSRYVIHSPTMKLPEGAATEENIRKSVNAALKVAEDNNISSISMPGMGTGIGGFEPIDAANIMIDEIRKFKAKFLKEVILIDISEIMVNAFNDAVEEK